MTKYTSASQRRAMPKPERPHPIWRGIGCVMILIVPIMSWVMALLTVQAAVDRNWPIPYQLMGNPVMPTALWNISGTAPILNFIQNQNNLYAVLALTFLYIVIFGAILSVAYALIYKFVGPSRLGPLDVAAPNVRVKRYKR